MGILDEAIREHLDLKRQHGAADSELKQLEDEAFGQAERPGDAPPDPAAEAPTQFMTQPEIPEDQGSKREPAITDLQEPPPPPAEEPQPSAIEMPAEEEPEPAAEAKIEPAGHSTEEREAIAEQPTEMFDVEEELGGPPIPTDEELIEEEIAEPRLAPTDPLAGLEEGEEAEVSVQGPAPDDDDEYDDEDDAFWNEQRLSDELDQALEAPADEADSELEEPEYDDEPDSAEEEVPEPVSEAEVPSSRHDEEDLLEETPDFLEEAPEDDQLWFEQKPPKDFDFDD